MPGPGAEIPSGGSNPTPMQGMRSVDTDVQETTLGRMGHPKKKKRSRRQMAFAGQSPSIRQYRAPMAYTKTPEATQPGAQRGGQRHIEGG